MSNLFNDIQDKLKGKHKSIVFPEGLDERVLTAASQLGAADILTPILIGEKAKIKQQAEAIGVDVSSCKLMDPREFEEFDLMVETFVERRKGKATKEDAQNILDRKSTRLNSSHVAISYAVFCLKKKKI